MRRNLVKERAKKGIRKSGGIKKAKWRSERYSFTFIGENVRTLLRLLSYRITLMDTLVAMGITGGARCGLEGTLRILIHRTIALLQFNKTMLIGYPYPSSRLTEQRLNLSYMKMCNVEEKKIKEKRRRNYNVALKCDLE